ncbi:MAG: radical SAM protein [Candidatus Riflebacteria bacterium]|nr:radical SAM protein [Candidatus Riflebacteria bacterium]
MEVTNASPDAAKLALVRVGTRAIVVSCGLDPVVTLDRQGRVVYLIRRGRTYHRGLDGTIVEKTLTEGGLPVARLVAGAKVRESLVADCCLTVDDVCGAAVRGLRGTAVLGHQGVADPLTDLQAWLEHRSIRTAADHNLDTERFGEVYDPVPVLPPDQYLALVLEAATGCPWNACRFCTLYAGRHYNVRSPAEFAAHLEKVLAFIGAGLSYRRSVFLGDASLSRIRPETLADRVFFAKTALAAAGSSEQWSFHAFADAFTPAAWSAHSLSKLVPLGFRRFHIGVETGCQALLDAVHKPQSPAKVVELFRNLKAAGLAVGCILLVGLGGRAFAERHTADTLALVERLPLDSEDLVYLSPLAGDTTVHYSGGAFSEPLNPVELSAQEARLREGLRVLRGTRRFQLARYDLEQFVY